VSFSAFNQTTLILTAVVMIGGGGCTTCRNRQQQENCPPGTSAGSAANAAVPAERAPAAARRRLEDEYPDFRGSRRVLPDDDDDDAADRAARSSGSSAPGRSTVSDQRGIARSTPRAANRNAFDRIFSKALPVESRQIPAPAQTASANLSPGMSGRKRLPESDRESTASQPVRITDPPVLETPPIDGEADGRTAEGAALFIPRIQICRQVRGFDDVVPLDPRRLHQGQPILIYATLENARSVPTSQGHRTLTLSTLEVRTSSGELLDRQPLGTAVDLAEVPRAHYFLTHQVTIPRDLPPGEYTFGLCVDDLLGRGSAQARLSVCVKEDRSPRGGTADTSKSATRPASFRK
jgi:hypothetical protein